MVGFLGDFVVGFVRPFPHHKEPPIIILLMRVRELTAVILLYWVLSGLETEVGSQGRIHGQTW